MPNLYGKQYTKDELLKRVGDISQIAGVRLIELDDGFERGARAAEFYTGSGLEFTVMIDRALDISMASFQGKSLSWRSSVTDKHPSYYDDKGAGWLRSFPGGLIATCGLTYIGASCEDEGESLGLHGRISNTPATNVYADGRWLDDDSYEIWIQGKARETTVFGENIQMERRISTKLGGKSIKIYDKVTNLGFQRSEHMILYHINAGYPVVDGTTKLLAPTRSYQPRDEEAQINKELYAQMLNPIHGFKEKVYYHDLGEDENGNTSVALINTAIDDGFGFYVKFNKNELPKFVQWKNHDERDYVVGLEPSNSWVSGRDQERKQGTLQYIEPGETKEYHLEIGVLSTSDEIDAYKNYVSSLK